MYRILILASVIALGGCGRVVNNSSLGGVGIGTQPKAGTQPKVQITVPSQLSCGQTLAQIQAAIQGAQSCHSDNDCAHIYGPTRDDCGNLPVQASRAAAIEAQVDSYLARCFPPPTGPGVMCPMIMIYPRCDQGLCR